MTKLIGGKTIPVTHLRVPRCGTCGAHTFLKGERFDHSNEVRITAVCDHGQGDFMEDSRIFHGDAWDKRGVELVFESFNTRAPFPKSRSSKTQPPSPSQPPKAQGAWFVKVDRLVTGDVVVGPLADLQHVYLPEGQQAVIVSTTKGANDYRVRYRSLPDDRYGTFVCRGSLEVTMLGNEYVKTDGVSSGQ